MAFHYQNLIQETDFKYPEFEKQYEQIKKFARYQVNEVRRTHKVVTAKELFTKARSICKPTCYMKGETLEFPKKQERLLLVTNILFPDDGEFLKLLQDRYDVSKETCYQLKDTFNWFKKEDEDYLDGTMDGIVHHYIPNFDLIAEELKMRTFDEFIIWKLLEIMYIKPDLLEKEKQKI